MSEERDLEAYLVKRCKQIGLLQRKVQWVGRAGAPDRVIFGPGRRAIWVELKSLHGKVSVLQEREHARLRALGQPVFEVRTRERLEEVLEYVHA